MPPAVLPKPVPPPKALRRSEVKTEAKTEVKREQTDYSFNWITAEYVNDLHILEDDDYWSMQMDDHKLSAVTAPFSFVLDQDERVVDITPLEALQSVGRTLYLDNSWHQDAKIEKVYKDIENLPDVERQSLLSCFRLANLP